MKIEYMQSEKTSDWFWHIRGRNGRIVTAAETFPTKQHVVRAVKSFAKSMGFTGKIVEVDQATGKTLKVLQ